MEGTQTASLGKPVHAVLEVCPHRAGSADGTAAPSARGMDIDRMAGLPCKLSPFRCQIPHWLPHPELFCQSLSGW